MRKLIYMIFGKKAIGVDMAANGDIGCKMTGYWLKGKVLVTKVEYTK